MPPTLEVIELGHRFSEKPVLSGVSFHLEEGQIGCLLGPSGCGKTPALWMAASSSPTFSPSGS